jgi:hypothetical protein
MHIDLEYAIVFVDDASGDARLVATAASVQLAMATATRHDVARWPGDLSAYEEMRWSGIIGKRGLVSDDRDGAHYEIFPQVRQKT